MKRFCELTDPEILALTTDQFQDAIKLEAIHRGVAVPVPLSEALRTSEWRGFQQPADGSPLYEIMAPGQYGDHPQRTGVAFPTEAQALRAMEGAISVRYESYGAKLGHHLNRQDGWAVARVFIQSTPAVSTWAKFEAASVEVPEFDKVAEECAGKWSEVIQANYDHRVNLERKAEYLRLAGGDEGIAKAFWAKAYPGTEWPTE